MQTKRQDPSKQGDTRPTSVVRAVVAVGAVATLGLLSLNYHANEQLEQTQEVTQQLRATVADQQSQLTSLAERDNRRNVNASSPVIAVPPTRPAPAEEASPRTSEPAVEEPVDMAELARQADRLQADALAQELEGHQVLVDDLEARRFEGTNDRVTYDSLERGLVDSQVPLLAGHPNSGCSEDICSFLLSGGEDLVPAMDTAEPVLRRTGFSDVGIYKLPDGSVRLLATRPGVPLRQHSGG
jgi:hypothetical protein